MRKLLNHIATDQRGATAVEYGLILTLVALAAMTALNSLSGSVAGRWNENANEVENAIE